MSGYVRVTWEFRRNAYVIRPRQWQLDLNGRATRMDTQLKIPKEVFRKAGVPGDVRSKRADVIAANYAAKRERELNEPDRKLRMTLSEIGDQWLESRKRKDPKTLASDRLLISYAVAFFADRDPSTIDIGAAELYRDWLFERGVVARLGKRELRKMSPRSVYNAVAFLPRLLEFGYERKRDTGMTALELRAVPEVEGKAGLGGARKMSIDEFWRAYEAAGRLPRVGTKLQVTLALGLATWLRLEALLNLQVTWIDAVEATVRVPPEFMKGGKTELILPLNRFAMASIQRVTMAFPKALHVLPVNPRTHRPATNLFHTLRAIAAGADMPPFSLHSIRKTAASLILNHRCDYCRHCRMFLADHKRDRCANGETTFFPTHAAGVKKIVADRILAHAMPQMDTAYFEVDLESMRDALSVIDEEWERYNRRSEGKVIEIAARRA